MYTNRLNSKSFIHPLLLIALAAGLCACVQTPKDALQVQVAGGRAMLAEPFVSGATLKSPPEGASLTTLTTAAPGGNDALRLEILKGDLRPWGVELQASTRGAVKAGDRLIAICLLRAAKPFNTDADAHVGFSLYDGAPWNPLVSRELHPDSQWRRYVLPFTATQDHADGSVVVALLAGYQAQAIEIGGLEVFNSGSGEPVEIPQVVNYPGRSPEAAWRNGIEDGIENFRKGRLAIEVTDEDGHALPGAQVLVEMQQSDFRVGVFASRRMLLDKKGDAAEFMELAPQLFNSITLETGLNWSTWSDEESGGRREATLNALDNAKRKGLRIYGGPLVWPGWDKWNPSELKKLDKDQLRARIIAHIKDVTSRMSTQVDAWDVVNEWRTNSDFTDVLGKQAAVEWFSRTAFNASEADLYLTDFGIFEGPEENLNTLLEQAAFLKAKGAPLSGVGIRCHLGHTLPPLSHILSVLDKIEDAGLTVEIAEFDLSIPDEAAQADYIRDLLMALYSHPAVNGISFSNFWEGHSARAYASLMNKDWSPKPAAVALSELVNEAWKTREAALTDENGKFVVRGHVGTYDVLVSLGAEEIRRTVKLSPAGHSVKVILEAPAPEPEPEPEPVPEPEPKEVSLQGQILKTPTQSGPPRPQPEEKVSEVQDPAESVEVAPVEEVIAPEEPAPEFPETIDEVKATIAERLTEQLDEAEAHLKENLKAVDDPREVEDFDATRRRLAAEMNVLRNLLAEKEAAESNVEKTEPKKEIEIPQPDNPVEKPKAKPVALTPEPVVAPVAPPAKIEVSAPVVVEIVATNEVVATPAVPRKESFTETAVAEGIQNSSQTEKEAEKIIPAKPIMVVEPAKKKAPPAQKIRLVKKTQKKTPIKKAEPVAPVNTSIFGQTPSDDGEIDYNAPVRR